MINHPRNARPAIIFERETKEEAIEFTTQFITDDDYQPLPGEGTTMKIEDIYEELAKAGQTAGNVDEGTCIDVITEMMLKDRDHFDNNLYDMLEPQDDKHKTADQKNDEFFRDLCAAMERMDLPGRMGDDGTRSITLTFSLAWVGLHVVKNYMSNTRDMVERDMPQYFEELGEYFNRGNEE